MDLHLQPSSDKVHLIHDIILEKVSSFIDDIDERLLTLMPQTTIYLSTVLLFIPQKEMFGSISVLMLNML